MLSMMRVIESKDELRELCAAGRRKGETVGFVPTMGHLHEGHLSLVRLARERCDLLVVSVFVNPTQFSPSEDYSGYPRDFDRDSAVLEKEGCDICFHPKTGDLYPPGYSSWVEVEELSRALCGRSRPTHFRGVTTVVAKLFNIVRPNFAIFGAKDAQQALVVKRMVRDLNFDTEIVIGPTVREKDGLAMSSRNEYLTPEERKDATLLYQSLLRAKELIEKGERDPEVVLSEMRRMVEGVPTSKIDYVSVVDTDNLKEMSTLRGEVLIALAVWFGKARLIDNLILQIE